MTLQLPLYDGTQQGLQHILNLIAMTFPVGPENVKDVLKLSVAGTQRKLALGSSSVTFTASANSAQITVPHGLGVGVTPVLVAAFCKTPANTRATIQESAAADATNIFLTGFQTQGTAITATQNIYWAAIG